jgi:hypothetical protein
MNIIYSSIKSVIYWTVTPHLIVSVVPIYISWQIDSAMQRPDMDSDITYAMVFRMHQTEASIPRQRFPSNTRDTEI